ncbi:MAG TPA: patatin-like phospholipase family protein [Macromonas sp.]|nr:patatin-like phospholipase family protein [Macromonas sp.]
MSSRTEVREGVVQERRQWLLGTGALLAWALTGCSVPLQPPQEPPKTEPRPPQWRAPRIGLALGGGAARGFAHVGVIEVLEQNGIRPDCVVGTSAGSLVAALYASGMGANDLMNTALQMEEAAIADWTLPIFNRGLLRGEALARYVNKQVQGRTLQEMRLPLGILATDLATGKGVLFQRGDTGTAVRASSAVPGVFTPVAIGGRQYVDGGLVAPVPVEQARQMGAELVIGVDISSAPDHAAANDALSVVLQTFTIMGQSINRYILTEADVVVRPQLNGVGSADFAARQKSIAAGREAMQAALPKLREQLQAKRRLVENG